MNAPRAISAAALAAFVTGSVGTAVLAAKDAPESGPVSRSLAREGVVWHGMDLGVGEQVILVVGGAFPTRHRAEEANGRIAFGDLQGYYVAPVSQFAGLGEVLRDASAKYVLVTAFRTDRGAREFLALSRAAGAPALVTPRLLNLGSDYVGLGQEPHPDGSGPLIGPLPGVSTP